MRTNILIDDELMTQALEASGFSTKRAAVEAGLRLLIQVHSQSRVRGLRGKVHWNGNLEAQRVGRFAEEQADYHSSEAGDAGYLKPFWDFRLFIPETKTQGPMTLRFYF